MWEGGEGMQVAGWPGTFLKIIFSVLLYVLDEKHDWSAEGVVRTYTNPIPKKCLRRSSSLLNKCGGWRRNAGRGVVGCFLHDLFLSPNWMSPSYKAPRPTSLQAQISPFQSHFLSTLPNADKPLKPDFNHLSCLNYIIQEGFSYNMFNTRSRIYDVFFEFNTYSSFYVYWLENVFESDYTWDTFHSDIFYKEKYWKLMVGGFGCGTPR